MTDSVNISSTAIFILGIAILVSIVILIGGIICIRRIRPSSNHCQVRCLRDHYADVTTSGGYGTSSTTPSCNKLHVTGSCPSDYAGSGNDYARMRLQQRFNNYPGDYSSMASLMTYEPTRAPTFQTNLPTGSVQPLHYGISGEVGYPQDGLVHSPPSHHAIIDANRLRQIGDDPRRKVNPFGMSCGNIGAGVQKNLFVTGTDAADHQKSVSEPYPLFGGPALPHVMEHIYESPDTLLLKRKEMPRDQVSLDVVNTKNVSFDVNCQKVTDARNPMKVPQNCVGGFEPAEPPAQSLGRIVCDERDELENEAL